MEDNVKVKVKNRSLGPIYYSVPEMNNLRREYQPKEEKTVFFEELRKLYYTTGGKVLLDNYLIIEDKEALEELGMHVEPEYFYEEEQVIDLLENGSMDEFLDCLDFAPEGVRELVKQLSVRLPLNDVAKRKVLLDRYDFNVEKTIEIVEANKEENEEQKEVVTGRRASPRGGSQSERKAQSSGRRVSVKQEK